jgi:hypothetical protein
LELNTKSVTGKKNKQSTIRLKTKLCYVGGKAAKLFDFKPFDQSTDFQMDFWLQQNTNKILRNKKPQTFLPSFELLFILTRNEF